MAESVSKRVVQGDATRSHLLTVARTLFGRDGYGSTSLQAIVDAAGVTKGAFYHHFDSKQELFLHVFEQVQHEVVRAAFVVHLEHEQRGGTDPVAPGLRDLASESNDQVWEHLVAGCRTYLELHMRSDVQRIVLIDGRAVLPWSDWHRIHSEHGVVLLRADLRRAEARRTLRPVSLHQLATMLTGALHEACIAIAHAPEPEKALDEAMQVIIHFLRGVRSD